MNYKTLITAAFAAVFLAACGGDTGTHGEHGEHSAAAEAYSEQEAHAAHEHHASYERPDTTGAFAAILHGTEGNDNIHGYVMFQPTAEGVFVLAHVEGLEPNGVHGFHVHEFGDCSAPDATSAGGHFNPHGADHGGPESDERHVGDLGNLHADDTGMAHLEWTDHKLELSGPNSIVGKAVIVHAQPDDLTSQPVGNAGARIACGVIVDEDGEHHH